MFSCKVQLAVFTRNEWSGAGAQVHTAYGFVEEEVQPTCDRDARA